MAKPYTINVSDGTGSLEVLNGSYSVSANVTGYDNTSINPASLNITADTNNYALTIAATGTLTLHVTDTGLQGGTPIVGATFIRTDASGNTYGTTVTTDASGDAVFANVPFAASDAPLIYYKQTASDGEHEFSADVQSTSLSSSTSTVEIMNANPASRTFTLTDANYENLPISGTITLN